MSGEITLRLLSLNCWGIPYVSSNRVHRMGAISEHICSGEYDIVCLQEVWLVSDYKMIKAKVQEHLSYSHYFYSGVLGSGICIFSRYPIEDVMFHRWSLNGYVHKIHHGDWFGGKGVGLCRLRVNDANINVYVAHLHAEYNVNNDEYYAHRILQAFDMAQFIRMTERGADAAILGGDLNTGPGDLAYKIIHGVAGLVDACSNESCDVGTSECAYNSYTPSSVARKCPAGKRIDHILYMGSKNFKIEVANFKLPLPQRVPDKNFSYSDHEAVSADLKLTKGEYEVCDVDVRDSLKEALRACEESLHTVRRQRIWYTIACCLLVVPLFWSMGVDAMFHSIGVSIGLNIVRLLGTGILCYALFMSTIWNCVEQNALRAGCLGMEIHLLQLNNSIERKNCGQLPSFAPTFLSMGVTLTLVLFEELYGETIAGFDTLIVSFLRCLLLICGSIFPITFQAVQPFFFRSCTLVNSWRLSYLHELQTILCLGIILIF